MKRKTISIIIALVLCIELVMPVMASEEAEPGKWLEETANGRYIVYGVENDLGEGTLITLDPKPIGEIKSPLDLSVNNSHEALKINVGTTLFAEFKGDSYQTRLQLHTPIGFIPYGGRGNDGTAFISNISSPYAFNTPGVFVVEAICEDKGVWRGNYVVAVIEVVGSVPTPPVQSEIQVLLNGVTIVFDQPPIIENGRTLVPLRAIFEAMSADVKWEPSTQTVTATRGDITITLKIGSNELVRNDEIIELDVPAKIVGGRTLVPARAVAESFGADVKWIQATRTVTITE